MSTYTFPHTISIGGGWTCQQCGYWVPSGSTHYCPSAIRWMNPPPPPTPTAVDRIAAALERIAKALEQQTGDSP
jgi:hypothetical protein